MNRLNKHEYYMAVAEQAACRATCTKRKAGAVIVKNDAIVSTGYNGSVKGMLHCGESLPCARNALSSDVYSDITKDKTFCRAMHAEQNAICNAARNGIQLLGTTMYSTAFPCIVCSKNIIAAGITKVYYREPSKPREEALQALLYDERLLIAYLGPENVIKI